MVAGAGYQGDQGSVDRQSPSKFHMCDFFKNKTSTDYLLD